MTRRNNQLLIGAAALAFALALPAIAQDRPETILPPGFGDPTPTPTPTPSSSATPATKPSPSEGGAVEIVDRLAPAETLLVAKPVPQVEYPASSRRVATMAGLIDVEAAGVGARPWGAATPDI